MPEQSPVVFSETSTERADACFAQCVLFRAAKICLTSFTYCFTRNYLVSLSINRRVIDTGLRPETLNGDDFLIPRHLVDIILSFF